MIEARIAQYKHECEMEKQKVESLDNKEVISENSENNVEDCKVKEEVYRKRLYND